jgi:hypothetical protein
MIKHSQRNFLRQVGTGMAGASVFRSYPSGGASFTLNSDSYC